MKTEKKTRVSFSDNTLNITLPTSWLDLTQDELKSVCDLMSRVDADNIRYYIFKELTGAKIERVSKNQFLLYFNPPEIKKRIYKWVTAEEISELIECLNFISDPGNEPVRLDKIRGYKAVDAQFHGVPFSNYIAIENLYQGFIQSKEFECLDHIAQILYPGIESITGGEVINVLNWLIQIKGLFSRNFPNFFKPASGSGEIPSMLEVMNNEIRALTGGDVTKEEVIFSTDCWRALTELDFKSKDAEEFNKQMAKHKTR